MKPVSSTKSEATPNTEILTPADVKALKAHFPKDKLGVKVLSFNKEKTRAMLVVYLPHTAVQERLEEIDPTWTSEVLDQGQIEKTFYVRSRLTIKGVVRENLGEGFDPKSAYSDALKRCASLFGIGRYLYSAPAVWVPYDEARDRYRQWKIQDVEAVSSGNPVPTAA